MARFVTWGPLSHTCLFHAESSIRVWKEKTMSVRSPPWVIVQTLREPKFRKATLPDFLKDSPYWMHYFALMRIPIFLIGPKDGNEEFGKSLFWLPVLFGYYKYPLLNMQKESFRLPIFHFDDVKSPSYGESSSISLDVDWKHRWKQAILWPGWKVTWELAVPPFPKGKCIILTEPQISGPAQAEATNLMRKPFGSESEEQVPEEIDFSFFTEVDWA